MRLLLTRPREDAEVLAVLLRERGVEAVIEPLIFVRDVNGPGLDLAGVQAHRFSDLVDLPHILKRYLQ